MQAYQIASQTVTVFNPGKNGDRPPDGGSMPPGLKRCGIVKHPKYGKCYVGAENVKTLRVRLHCPGTGKRLTQDAQPSDCKLYACNSWRTVKPSF